MLNQDKPRGRQGIPPLPFLQSLSVASYFGRYPLSPVVKFFASLTVSRHCATSDIKSDARLAPTRSLIELGGTYKRSTGRMRARQQNSPVVMYGYRLSYLPPRYITALDSSSIYSDYDF